MTAVETRYKLFGVAPTCTAEELHKAFLDRVFEAHPDRNADRIAEATRRTQALTSAYTELKAHHTALSNDTPDNITDREVYFTKEINGLKLTISGGSSFGVDLQDIRDRRDRFRDRWEDLQKNISDPIRALFLIHAACEAERFDAVTSLLQNKSLIDLASLLLINIEAGRACQTFIRWADFLWNTRRGKEAVQILEDAVASRRVQITKDDVDRSLPSIIDELQSFHYRWAQYADPTTGVKAAPEVRIEHLNRILELGFRFGYIYKFLAEAHHDLGDDEQARAYLTQSWEIDPCLSGAVRIARALGLSAPPKSDEPALISLISPKWTRLQQVPTESQIRQWEKDGRWDTIIRFSNPAEYSRALLPKARNALRLIAIFLGECDNYEGAAEALSIMLSSFYWDIRDAAVTSLAKIGDEDTLAFVEDLSAGVNWNEFSKERLKTSIAYLRARVSGKPDQAVKPASSDVLARALRAHERRQYGLARFLLEGVMTEINDGHPSYLEATVALARSCAEMNDTKAAIGRIEPVFTMLKNVGNRSIMTDIRDWLWNNVVFEEYAEERDDIYKWGLELDLALALSAKTPDDVLRPFRNLTRWLEVLGAAPTAHMIRELIRTEAPGTLYVDKHDRINYFRKVTLSEEMRNFLEEFDTRIRCRAVVKVKEVMGGERSIEHAGRH